LRRRRKGIHQAALTNSELVNILKRSGQEGHTWGGGGCDWYGPPNQHSQTGGKIDDKKSILKKKKFCGVGGHSGGVGARDWYGRPKQHSLTGGKMDDKISILNKNKLSVLKDKYKNIE
jgi:hypothetical protein